MLFWTFLIHFLIQLHLLHTAWSFSSGRALQSDVIPTFSSSSRISSLSLYATKETSSDHNSIDIVLFGVGDLRTTDHGGLSAALSRLASTSSNQVLPLIILDTEDTLPNIPMARTNTLDTASLLSSGIKSLQKKLSTDMNLHLHVKSGKNGLKALMEETLDEIKVNFPDVEQIIIHTCDLGDVDNQLGYGPLSHLDGIENEGGGLSISVEPWTCHLRDQVWADVKEDATKFPSSFLDYDKQYDLDLDARGNSATLLSKISTSAAMDIDTVAAGIESMKPIPSLEEVSELLCTALKLDMEDEDMKRSLKQEHNTGLYATHWGGLDVVTFDEDSALETVKVFLGKGKNGDDGDEALLKAWNWWSGDNLKLERNDLSLEHAAMNWMMTGGDLSTESASGPIVKTESLIEGELLTRYMAAPLLFGLVSPRYIRNAANEAAAAEEKGVFDDLLPSLFKSRKTISTVISMCESREWHKLCAAKNLLENGGKEGDLSVGYWRWHGFLCRYVNGTLNENCAAGSNEKKGIALVHGFGASGSQWKKTIEELAENFGGEQNLQALAPDLIGFGQSEKPSLTYTQYLWESYVMGFLKEIAFGREDWTSFIIGGNSIGGYVSMCTAADDAVFNGKAGEQSVTASGANGPRKCDGLVLMNSAGRIFREEEIKTMATNTGATVAEATANDMLGKSSPPPRQVASIGGTALLWYLRPRIQSICRNLYPTNPGAVDDILCGGILRDSLDPGAINVMISGSKLPPPRTANELLGADFGSSKNRGYETSFLSEYKEGTFDGPVLVAQGVLDPLNDAKDRAELLRKLRKGIKIDPLNAGHCPHDELPGDIAKSISKWMINDIEMVGAKVVG